MHITRGSILDEPAFSLELSASMDEEYARRKCVRVMQKITPCSCGATGNFFITACGDGFACVFCRECHKRGPVAPDVDLQHVILAWHNRRNSDK